jgi:hypothetical protein
MDKEQKERFEEAVRRKSEAAERASHATGEPAAERPGGVQGDQPNLTAPGEQQDSFSVRDKNTGHGKKTADKWNQ